MRSRILALVALMFVLTVAPAAEASVFPEIRPRAGVGFTPDQFVVGAQALLRARLGVARLAPSIDVGFGDNVTATVINLDVLSKVLPVGKSVGLYGGAGVSFAIFSGDGASDSQFGGTLVGGADFGNRFFGEARFGLDEMPDLRLLAGLRLIRK